MARLLLSDRTKPGDVVLDVDDDVAFAATAAQMGRRHHALGGERYLASMSHAAGYIDLMLLHWPRPAVNPHRLLRACQPLFGSTGCLVVAVSAGADHRLAHLSALASAGTAVGLRTVQHVVVLAPDAATSAATAEPSGGQRGRREAGPLARGHGVGEVRAPHTDLLIFQLGAADDE
ncbi:hypothetical protein WEI85_19690 [Actinomycetes bacterium KLBMP 9797]